MSYKNYRQKLIQILYVSGKNNKWEFEYSWNYEKNKFRESVLCISHLLPSHRISISVNIEIHNKQAEKLSILYYAREM